MKKLNLKVRLKNPVFWVQIGSAIVLTALTYNAMQPCDLTTWQGLGQLLLGTVKNPYLLGMCAVSVWSAINDPTTAGMGDSTQAMKYTEPKK